jgi:hypothetical protein
MNAIDKFERFETTVPGRLNDALRYAVSRVEEDQLIVEATLSHLGWNGTGAGPENGPKQLGREVQTVERTIARLCEDGFIPDAVERSIAVAERSLPILDRELCEVLLDAKLCFVRFSCGALATAAAIFRRHSPFELVSFGHAAGLVKLGTTDGINQLVESARNLMQTRGCANIINLAGVARKIFGANTSQAFAEAAVRSAGRFEWLNQETGWFWYIPLGDDQNRLVDQIKRVLSVAPCISLTDLRTALRRVQHQESFTPPLSVLAAICKRLLFTYLEGDKVVQVASALQWASILDPQERTLMDILKLHGPLLRHEEFLKHCCERGINENSFGQLSAHSVILQSPCPGMYALVGVTIPGDIENGGTLAYDDHGFLPDAKVFLCWKLSASDVQSGVLRVIEPVSTFMEGDYNLKSVTGSETGSIQIRQRALWNVRPLLCEVGADVGDILTVILCQREHLAIGMVGNEAVAAKLTAGDFNFATVVPHVNEIDSSPD